ncbi:hypothetical protein [Dyella nitratireducens]|uniref:Uncharacterized protein n=1 Tax=Dyella nitratireducens TaxID=1849580 RepID=A0ABQ1FRC0_9GAMM|nr:hypothetical protein [Dyella nitratireducens]GGA25283.1 hypothetical protein GCM10010981_12270 [Dyella nitratireducens]GLQ43710.1 hypothetical protein GCM10007902_35600 [Dyella nitratireducens]
MRRLLLTLPLLGLPLMAAGQTLSGDQLSNSAWTQQPQTLLKTGQQQPMQGSLLVEAQSGTTAGAQNDGSSSLSLNPLFGGTVNSSTVQYGVTPNISAQAGVTQRSWATQPRIISSEVGATYNAGRYSLGVSVAQDQVPNATPLPRVLPGAVPGVNGLPDFDSSTQVNARGRFALNGNSGVLLGASMGRIRLLPGNQLGLTTLDQRALSFGIEHGPVSTSIVGRTMQPEPGTAVPGMLNADRRWNSIDLGVTWHLPWQGSLSFGAQNLWSSGNAANTPAGPPEPDQSRTPYVQYHQDL